MDYLSGSASGPTFSRWALATLTTLGLLTVPLACQPAVDDGSTIPSVAAKTSEDAGRYLVTLGGCNDCHTDGYLESNGAMDESGWLSGSVVGWRGPWGTTYPPNLRLTVQKMSEDQWVEMLATRSGLPPMPWPSVNRMSDEDRRAIYRFLRRLGPTGVPRTPPLAPDMIPEGPWIDMDVKGLPAPAMVGTGA